MTGGSGRSTKQKQRGAAQKVSGNEGEENSGRGGMTRKDSPVFELIVLGSGGGPLETDCSGYLLKPVSTAWEDGVIGLEGGSGLGALSLILDSPDAPARLFPDLTFPPDYTTPVLRAAYVFSFLTCYLITHAHLDHTLSLIMLTGSVPPRPDLHPQPPLIKSPPSSRSTPNGEPAHKAPQGKGKPPRPPIYATRDTLERLAGAYGGGLWPELGTWAPESSSKPPSRTEPPPGAGAEGTPRKRRRHTGNFGVIVEMGTGEATDHSGPGVVFTPTEARIPRRPLHPGIPISTLTYPVCHGSTSHGLYTSSAVFIRHDPDALSAAPRPAEDGQYQREFLFFGDLEGETSPQEQAGGMNREIWQLAAESWSAGKLAAVFLMYGHLNPPALYHELRTMASFVPQEGSEPRQKSLDGLRVYITHIKEALAPHPTGKTSREMIMAELRDLEREGGLGVDFVEVKKGDRSLHWALGELVDESCVTL